MEADRIGAIILAAGRSRRFGSDKRRHLLAATVALYQSCFEAVRIVLRPEDDTLLTALEIELRESDEIVHASLAHLGMGHSLAAGVADLEEHDQFVGLFIGLGDMPYIQPETLHELKKALAAAQAPAIVRPYFDGQAGQPVGFTAEYLPELAAMEGDQGARALISAYKDRVLRFDTTDSGVVEDVDVPEDLRQRSPKRVAQSSLERQDS